MQFERVNSNSFRLKIVFKKTKNQKSETKKTKNGQNQKKPKKNQTKNWRERKTNLENITIRVSSSISIILFIVITMHTVSLYLYTEYISCIIMLLWRLDLLPVSIPMKVDQLLIHQVTHSKQGIDL